ncbi:MAG: hypothetical protein J5633_04670 [Oscillospiraceae bacterium]|nr:hypothetical protein [Oscillospiraceae bacterium]
MSLVICEVKELPAHGPLIDQDRLLWQLRFRRGHIADGTIYAQAFDEIIMMISVAEQIVPADRRESDED